MAVALGKDVASTDEWHCAVCMRKYQLPAESPASVCTGGADALLQVPVNYAPTVFERLFDCPFAEKEVARCPSCGTDAVASAPCHVIPCIACHARIAARIVNSNRGRAAGAGASSALVSAVAKALE